MKPVKKTRKVKKSFYMQESLALALAAHCVKKSINMSQSDFVESVLSKALGRN